MIKVHVKKRFHACLPHAGKDRKENIARRARKDP